MKLKIPYESNLVVIQQLDEKDYIKSTLYNFSFEINKYIYFQILWHVLFCDKYTRTFKFFNVCWISWRNYLV